jgi:hypothetical protein
VHVDRTLVDEKVVSPDGAEQLLAGENMTRRECKLTQ